MLGRLVVVESSRGLGSLVYLDGDARSNRVAALRNEAARSIHGLGDPREGIYYGHHLIVPESGSRRSFITITAC